MSNYVFKYDLQYNPHLEALIELLDDTRVFLKKDSMEIFSPKITDIPIQNIPTELIRKLKSFHSANISTECNIFKDLKNIYWSSKNKDREILERINFFEQEIQQLNLEKKLTILLSTPENVIYNKEIFFKDYRQLRVSYRELDLAIFFLSFKITNIKPLMEIYFESEFPINNDIKVNFISRIQYFIPFAKIFLKLIREK